MTLPWPQVTAEGHFKYKRFLCLFLKNTALLCNVRSQLQRHTWGWRIISTVKFDRMECCTERDLLAIAKFLININKGNGRRQMKTLICNKELVRSVKRHLMTLFNIFIPPPDQTGQRRHYILDLSFRSSVWSSVVKVVNVIIWKRVTDFVANRHKWSTGHWHETIDFSRRSEIKVIRSRR